MPEFEITPAYSENVLCVFTIPREKGEPIVFSVRRWDYIPDFTTKLTAWSVERNQRVAVLDDDGSPVLDEHGEPKTVAAPKVSDREVILAQLKIAGVNTSTLNRLEKLTDGELTQIFTHWRAESRVTVGESPASSSS